ncbi:hypothetical protein ACFW04_006069 [Cataglyphis niger]
MAFTIKFIPLLAILIFLRIQSGMTEHAHSFAHFYGPVKGSGDEIIVHDKHGHQQLDYAAHPKYEFAYGIEDHHSGDYHGQKEHRDGEKVIGEYVIKEPGGNTRTVTYHVDSHGGFFAHVRNSGGNNHHGAMYDDQQNEQDEQEYH